MGLCFIIVKGNEIRRKELLLLQRASTFPAPEGFSFWERANRQQQFQQDASLCSFLLKRFAAKKPTKPRGLQALHCTTPVFATPSSPTQFHYAFLRGDAFFQPSLPTTPLGEHQVKCAQSCLVSQSPNTFLPTHPTS